MSVPLPRLLLLLSHSTELERSYLTPVACPGILLENYAAITYWPTIQSNPKCSEYYTLVLGIQGSRWYGVRYGVRIITPTFDENLLKFKDHNVGSLDFRRITIIIQGILMHLFRAAVSFVVDLYSGTSNNKQQVLLKASMRE